MDYPGQQAPVLHWLSAGGFSPRKVRVRFSSGVRSTIRSNSVGRVPPCQGGSREFKSRLRDGFRKYKTGLASRESSVIGSCFPTSSSLNRLAPVELSGKLACLSHRRTSVQIRSGVQHPGAPGWGMAETVP